MTSAERPSGSDPDPGAQSPPTREEGETRPAPSAAAEEWEAVFRPPASPATGVGPGTAPAAPESAPESAVTPIPATRGTESPEVFEAVSGEAEFAQAEAGPAPAEAAPAPAESEPVRAAAVQPAEAAPAPAESEPVRAAAVQPAEAAPAPAESGPVRAAAVQPAEAAPAPIETERPEEVEPGAAPVSNAGGWPRKLVGTLSLIGVALFAFLTGLFVFNNMIMPRLIHSTAEVKVPNLIELEYGQAEKTLEPLGLVLSRSGERFDPQMPRGCILSQDPPADTPVRGRRRVMVMVSLGQEFSSVPSLFGESLRSARSLLQRAGLSVGGISRAPSADVGEGLVSGTDPPAETVLQHGGRVALLISTGTGPEVYVMPELLGREISGVRRHLESLGFRVSTPPAAPTMGAIVFQDPPPGSRITIDTQITLQAIGRIIR